MANASPAIQPYRPIKPLVKRRGPGRLLPHRFGRYTLFDHVSRGGMADIYRARARTDLGAERIVVVKEVLPEIRSIERFSELLISEAKLASQLTHANIVTVEDLGRDDDTLFIAMEFVDGLDLRELLRGCARRRIPLPVEFALRIVMEGLRGLDYAHRAPTSSGRGIIHRDVSPSNILLSFEGEVKICDFGIARAHEAAGEALSAEVEGKAGYMSPEHAQGEAVDVRSDVFSMGIVLWELLSGRKLYRARPEESLLEVAARGVIPPMVSRGLPSEGELLGIVYRALSPSRRDRYSSAGAMLRDLEGYAYRAGLAASSLRFRDWLQERFESEVRLGQQRRERAVRALAQGPLVVLRPIAEATAQTARDTIQPADAIAETIIVKEERAQKASQRKIEDPPPSLAATTSDIPRAVEPEKSRAVFFVVLVLLIAAGIAAYLSQV